MGLKEYREYHGLENEKAGEVLLIAAEGNVIMDEFEKGIDEQSLMQIGIGNNDNMRTLKRKLHKVLSHASDPEMQKLVLGSVFDVTGDPEIALCVHTDAVAEKIQVALNWLDSAE